MSDGSFNVQSFGAKGDGITDDYRAFSSVISATNNSINKEVVIPAGTYVLASPITFPTGIKLRFMDGAVLSPNSDVTVTIDSIIDAGLYQIFNGNGSFTTNIILTVYPEWFGQYNPTALNDAAKFVTPTLGLIKLMGSNYSLNSQLILNGVSMEGQSIGATTIHVSSLGSGVPAIQFNPPSGNLAAESNYLKDFNLLGPGRYTLGQKTANVDGISINGKLKLWRVLVSYCNSGFVFNTQFGHISLQQCQSNNNYYGIYIQNDNGDNLISDCELGGNAMASIGCAPSINDGVKVSGLRVFRTHMGFSPYGIYQEAGNSRSVWLSEPYFDQARFESCGNGAIYSENAVNGQGVVTNGNFIQVGFSFNPVYKLSNKPADYAVVFGDADGFCYYEGGQEPFYVGTKGVWYLANNHANWFGEFNESDFTVGNQAVADAFHPYATPAKQMYGIYIQTNLSYKEGDINWSTEPSISGFVGQICTTSGQYVTTRWQANTYYNKSGALIIPEPSNGHVYRLDVIGWSGNSQPYFKTATNTQTNDTYPRALAGWHPNYSYGIGMNVYPVPENGWFYTVTKAGTTGQAQPTWPTTEGATVTDDNVIYTAHVKAVWREAGALAVFTYFGRINPMVSDVPTSGTFNYGALVYNNNPVPGGTIGWICTTAGTACGTEWKSNTLYNAVGQEVFNGSDVYQLVTPGASSAGGGPVSTGSNISDGTCVWNFVSPLAVFKTFGTIGS